MTAPTGFGSRPVSAGQQIGGSSGHTAAASAPKPAPGGGCSRHPPGGVGRAAGVAPVPWIGFDVNHPSRLGAAVRLIGELLSHGAWHPWRALVDEAAAAFPDLKRKTIDQLVYGMVRTRTVERKGKYNRRLRRDHRMVRLPQVVHGSARPIE